MENFTDVMRELLSAEAVLQVADAAALEQGIRTLLGNDGERRRLGERAFGVVQRNRGSLKAMIQGAEALLG
jgi:3-deoxy-D-manno-octulosonic-acid transferase